MLPKQMACGTGVGARVPVRRQRDHRAAVRSPGNWSTFRHTADTMAGPWCSESSFKTGELKVMMKANPMGMLWITLARWRSSLLKGTWRTPKAPSVGYPMGWTSEFTLLGDAMRGFGGAAAVGWHDEAGRGQRLTEIRDPGGERRYLFGVGEGPAEAKQDLRGMPEICVKFVSVATGKSLLAPLVTQLSTT